MTGFTAPPTADFTAFSQLAKEQGQHFGTLRTWVGGPCRTCDDFLGLLLPLQAVVPDVSDFFGARYDRCRSGMTGVVDRVTMTSDTYRHADRTADAMLRKAYPGVLPGFHEITGGPTIGSFDDTDITLPEPPSAETDTQKNIAHQLLVIRGEIGGAERVFTFLTGQSLVELLLTPLLGNYGRLKYLQDCYDELSGATYTVAGNLRKGTWRLATEWNGEAATAFESYLFRWHMGAGGLGDAAKVASNAFRDGYLVVTALVFEALREINKLIENEIKELAVQAAEMVAGDVAIEVVGLGPEDPLADIGAGIYTAYKLYKMYKIVQRIITAIVVIQKIFEGISAAVEAIGKAVRAVQDILNSPMPTVDELMGMVTQRGLEFEKNGGWDPHLGAARVGLLP